MTIKRTLLEALSIQERRETAFHEAMDLLCEGVFADAVDYTIGLMKKFPKMLEVYGFSFEQAKSILIQLRQEVQAGRLEADKLKAAKNRFTGVGAQVLNGTVQAAAGVAGLAKFFSTPPNKLDDVLRAITKEYYVLLRRKGMTPDDLDDVKADKADFNRAYLAIKPELEAASKKLVASLQAMATKMGGEFSYRIKTADSAFKKQQKKGYKLWKMADLVGARIVVPGPTELVNVVKAIEEDPQFQTIEKENHFLNPGPYNAVHYTVRVGIVLCEIQVNMKTTAFAQAIMHDLTYDDAKAVVKLSPKQKGLIIRVIDLLTLKSYSAWSRILKTGSGEPLNLVASKRLVQPNFED